ncbi:hypothetical protein ACLBXM_10230 [Xanthobacteraceae bacterium A53D]
MRNPMRALRQMTAGGRHTLLVRTGLGVALSLGTLGLAHMMPAEDQARPARTIPAAQAPAFDFGPGHRSAGASGPELPVEPAVLPAETAAPLPASRPPVVLVSAHSTEMKPAEMRGTAPKITDAKAYPAGVERFDRCQTLCESRDPAVFGAALPPPPRMPAAAASEPGLFEGAAKGTMAVLGDGRRMIDGALGSAASTLVGMKDAVVGAITPEH